MNTERSKPTDIPRADAEANKTTRVLISACLLGECCRYNAVVRRSRELVDREAIAQEVEWVPVCPEVLGGLSTPRPPASIVAGAGGSASSSVDGADVLDGSARVVTDNDDDVTAAFIDGAERALAIAREAGVEHACLKSRSPSCGFGELSADGGTRPGNGVFAELLLRAGIAVEAAEFDRT